METPASIDRKLAVLANVLEQYKDETARDIARHKKILANLEKAEREAERLKREHEKVQRILQRFLMSTLGELEE